jgi:predicted  nucleic acid-binding Zn-ribbon protein
MAKRTKTQKKNDSIARYKWLKVVLAEIDECKSRIDKLEKTTNYLSDELQKLQELQGDKNG